MPDFRDSLIPHSTKPSAKPQTVGQSIQIVKVAVNRTPLPRSRPRRDTVSAHAPDGTSDTNATTDHSTNSDEILPVLSPCSSNRSA